MEGPALCLGSASRRGRRGLQDCPGLVLGPASRRFSLEELAVLDSEPGSRASKLLEPHSGSVADVQVPGPLRIGGGTGAAQGAPLHSGRSPSVTACLSGGRKAQCHGTCDSEGSRLCFCTQRPWGGRASSLTVLPGAGTMGINTPFWGTDRRTGLEKEVYDLGPS